MKNLYSIFSIIFLLFFVSSSIAQSENLGIIELSLNNKEFKKYIAKDEMNQPIPIIVITNDHFSEFLEVDFEEKKLAIFSNKKEANLADNQVFVEIKKFKIRDDIGILKFKYNGYTLKIKHKLTNGVWTQHTFSLKGNKKRYFYSGSVNLID